MFPFSPLKLDLLLRPPVRPRYQILTPIQTSDRPGSYASVWAVVRVQVAAPALGRRGARVGGAPWGRVSVPRLDVCGRSAAATRSASQGRTQGLKISTLVKESVAESFSLLLRDASGGSRLQQVPLPHVEFPGKRNKNETEPRDCDVSLMGGEYR